MTTNLHYQVYSLTKDGKLEEPLTEPLLTRDRANKYFSDCIQCALVSIDEYGSIVEILDKNEAIINKQCKPKVIKRKNEKLYRYRTK